MVTPVDEIGREYENNGNKNRFVRWPDASALKQFFHFLIFVFFGFCIFLFLDFSMFFELLYL